MKTRFILNPRSGRNRRRPWLAPYIRKFIAERNLDATLVITARAGHATALAEAAVRDGCNRVIAVGGDGTMNEVAQALLRSTTALGLVPCGSGNGLALHLGIPTQLDQALMLAAAPDAVIAAIDTGSANGHAFFNAMGSGFDAEISDQFNHLERRGLPAYARTGFAAFRKRRSRRVVIKAGSRRHELDSLLVAVANSDQYGNHALVAPGARVDDGELDLIAVAPVSFLAAIPLIARLFTGRLLGSPKITRVRGARFTIEREESGLIHTDGETHRTGANVEILVHPRSLHVVLPKTTRFAPSNLLRSEPRRSALPMTVLPDAVPALECGGSTPLSTARLDAPPLPAPNLRSAPRPESNLLGYLPTKGRTACGNLLGYFLGLALGSLGGIVRSRGAGGLGMSGPVCCGVCATWRAFSA